jgi:hypothetical protein
MESVNDARYKQRAVIEFLVAEKESVTNTQKCLCNIYGRAAVNRGTFGSGVKTVRLLPALTVGAIWAMITAEDYSITNGVKNYTNDFREI